MSPPAAGIGASTETEGKLSATDTMPINAPSMLNGRRTGPKKGFPIAVLASGRGSDFQAIVDARERGEVDFEIGVLVCNVPGAMVLERAKKNGIPSVVIDHRGRSREDFEKELDSVLTTRGIELVVLAGFMRLFSPFFISRWKDRIVNIHPALLPSFPGGHAHRDALAYGVKVTGLTVHFVDEEVDHGPVIFQFPVEVKDDDTEETLSRRVLEKEHEWYPKIIQWIAEGRVRREGRIVRIIPR